MTKKKVVRIFDWKSNTFFPKRAQKCKNFNILSEKLDIFARGPHFDRQTPGLPRLSTPLALKYIQSHLQLHM